MAQQKRATSKQSGGWPATESAYDTISTLEELIALAPFTKASDGAGGTFTASARVPTFLQRKIEFLREMRGSPYQLNGDVVRDAIYVGLMVLNMRYSTNPDWAAESKIARALESASKLSRLKADARTIEESLKNLWDNKDNEVAISHLENFVAAILEVEDDYERSKRLQLIRESLFMKDVVIRCNQATQNAVFNLGDR